MIIRACGKGTLQCIKLVYMVSNAPVFTIVTCKNHCYQRGEALNLLAVRRVGQRHSASRSNASPELTKRIGGNKGFKNEFAGDKFGLVKVDGLVVTL